MVNFFGFRTLRNSISGQVHVWAFGKSRHSLCRKPRAKAETGTLVNNLWKEVKVEKIE